MNVAQRIQVWIETNGSFAEGVALYEAAGLRRSREVWRRVLDRGVVFGEDKEALRKELAEVGDGVIGGLGDKVQNSSVEGLKGLKGEPAAIQQLRQEARMWRKQLDHVHPLLSVVEEGEPLYQVAAEIMENITPAEDRVWSAIRAYEATGELPKPAQVSDIVRETVRKMQQVNSLRTKITRHEKNRVVMKETDYLETKVKLQGLLEELGLDKTDGHE